MAKATIPSGHESILFIDDEKSLLTLLNKLFARLGYTVFVASDGNTAESEFLKNSEIIELVVIDQFLQNQNGIELLKKFIAIKPDIKVILTSGYSIDEEFQNLSSSIVKEYLEKPYNVEQLARTVRKVLDS